ncbi:sensor histidine kinase [Caulobacter sp. KR2-114]|uniref:sensor histidine kinase n=1 Tax=Caulobacter sp. KR2-114 TaxID=3400912 RepID=UPI003C0B9850
MSATPDLASDHASRLLAAIVASSDDAIISKTVDGVVTSWNGGAERIFGYRAEEMIGAPINRLAVPGQEAEMPDILQRLRRGERVDHFETRRRRKDGAIVLVSLTVSPILDESGAIIGASKVARDITAQRAGEEALRQAHERLREQQIELLHAARLSELGQMAATMAHEVNQPLSAIVNYLRGGQNLIETLGPAALPRVADALQRASDQALRAGEVVRRLRAFARRDEGEQTAQSLNQMLEDAAALATLDAGQRGVTVSRTGPVPQDLVMADRIEVQQVLLNLIRNALDAMEERPRRELKLSAARDGDMFEVAVADTGCGLTSAVRERLFEPFVSTKPQGVGIGLSICKRIIEGHGGAFWANDNPDGGATFHFTLRAAQKAAINGFSPA